MTPSKCLIGNVASIRSALLIAVLAPALSACSGSTGSALQAISNPEWQNSGFGVISAAPWIGAGFTPQDAASWRSDRLSPQQARLWAAVGLSAVSAQQWIAAGFIQPPEAAAWAVATDFTCVSRGDFARCSGNGPDAAAGYRAAGMQPSDLAPYKAAGVPIGDPGKLLAVKALVPEAGSITKAWELQQAGVKPGGVAAFETAKAQRAARFKAATAGCVGPVASFGALLMSSPYAISGRCFEIPPVPVSQWVGPSRALVMNFAVLYEEAGTIPSIGIPASIVQGESAFDDWPQIHDPAMAAMDLRFDARGSRAIFGLQADLALTLGEVLQRHRKDCRWALDLDPGHRDMTSYRQICLLFDAPQAQAPTLDAFGVAQFAYRHCKQGSYTVMNYLDDTVKAYLGSTLAPGPTTPTVKLYDNADYHMSDPDNPDIPASWGATHLALFALWLAEHRLFADAVQQRSAPLLARSQSPFDWLWAERDGCLAEDDLTPEGNHLARVYYGTPDQSLHSGPGSYLQDFTDVLKGGDDEACVEDSWTNYDRLKPVIERRWAELRAHKLL